MDLHGQLAGRRHDQGERFGARRVSHAGVFVFITSSLVHMVFRWHAADYKALPSEDAVRTDAP